MEKNLNTNSNLIVNHDYFQEINHPNKAYWLGFIQTTGKIEKNNIFIKSTQDHISKFLLDLNSNSIANNFITINSKKIVNCIHIFEKCPKLLPEFSIRHYWRGIVDGTGTIGPTNPSINIRSNLLICERFLDFCKEFVETKAVIRSYKEKYKISLTGTKAIKIINILYANTERYLDQKKSQAKLFEIKKWIGEEWTIL